MSPPPWVAVPPSAVREAAQRPPTAAHWRPTAAQQPPIAAQGSRRRRPRVSPPSAGPSPCCCRHRRCEAGVPVSPSPVVPTGHAEVVCHCQERHGAATGRSPRTHIRQVSFKFRITARQPIAGRLDMSSPLANRRPAAQDSGA